MLFQLLQALALGVLLNVQKQLHQQVAPCRQLPFKEVHTLQPPLVLPVRQVAPQPLPHRLIHPPGIQE